MRLPGVCCGAFRVCYNTIIPRAGKKINSNFPHRRRPRILSLEYWGGLCYNKENQPLGVEMQQLYEKKINTAHGEKMVTVLSGDVLEIQERIDVLTVSSFAREYTPTPFSLFGAMHRAGINVQELSMHPYMDLRCMCDVWLSDGIQVPGRNIGRIGCVELRPFMEKTALNDPLDAIRAYFHMLDLASISGVELRTLAMPLLGAGDQEVSASLTLIPIVNECIGFLRRNPCTEKIIFFDINSDRAAAFVNTLSGMYSMLEAPAEPAPKRSPLAFISYSSKDKNVADNLCNKLESRGIRVWYAPRNVVGPYATAIMKGIMEADYFIVIVSHNSLSSQHVLNEIDNAHSRLPELKFKPLRLDDIALTPEFSYYLSRQHWLDATVPPLEEKLEAFVSDILAD